MDDLDRLFRRLVQNIRNGYPEYLTRQFEVAELFQNLVPYRHNRRELEIDTNQDYEMALCQLLSGERGYITGDQSMQEAIRRELGSTNANTAIFREFAASRVGLSADALRRYDKMAGAKAPASAASASAIDTQQMSAPAATRAKPQAAAPPPPPPVPPPAAARSAPPTATGSVPAGSSTATAPARGATGGAPSAAAAGCRYCGGALPNGRRVVYCPHCGQNLTIQRCPACSTELELGWKFCVTCGRSVMPA